MTTETPTGDASNFNNGGRNTNANNSNNGGGSCNTRRFNNKKKGSGKGSSKCNGANEGKGFSGAMTDGVLNNIVILSENGMPVAGQCKKFNKSPQTYADNKGM